MVERDWKRAWMRISFARQANMELKLKALMYIIEVSAQLLARWYVY